VRPPLWIALGVYRLVASLRKQLKREARMFTMLHLLSVRAFDQTPRPQRLAQADLPTLNHDAQNQLLLFTQ